jgi:hypothetical protein
MRNVARPAFVAVLAVGMSCAAYGTAKAPSHAPKALASTAAEVIARNVKARGGLDAWRKVNTMVFLGHLERNGKESDIHVPFTMHLERPNRTRFEIKERFSDYTRIFDGAHGWKVRPGTNGTPDLKSFSKEEVDYARDEFAIDGPLIDYAAKGVTADLDGIDMVDGRKAYRLSLKLASGAQRKIWIDTTTNLEFRYDRPATNPLAPGKPVSVYYDGYDTVEGLKLPHSLQVSSAPDSTVRETGDKLVIDKMLVNAKLDADTFLPPPTPMHRGGKVLIPSDGTPMGGPGRPTGPPTQ